MPPSSKTLSLWFRLAWIVLALLPVFSLCGIGGYAFLRAKNAIREEVQQTLATLAVQKNSQIDLWLSSVRQDAILFCDRTPLSGMVERWFQDGRKDDAMEKSILGRLEQIRNSRHYSSLTVFDGQGQAVLKVGEPDVDEHSQFALAVIRDGETKFVDLHRKVGGQIEFGLMSPFITQTGQAIGTLYLEINADDYLYPLLQSWPIPHFTTESFLVRRDGSNIDYISPMHIEAIPAMTKRVPLDTPRLPAAAGLQGFQGIYEHGIDYRGKPVLSYVSSVKAMPWVMEVKMDEEETDAPIHRLGWYFGTALAAILFFTYWIVWLIWRNQTLRHRLAKSAALYARNLIETSLDPLVTISTEGKITDVNAATEALTGWPRDALIGSDFVDYFAEPLAARAGYLQVFQTGSVRDYALEIRHRDGHLSSVLYNAAVYRDESGNVVGVFAAARDITERKRMEDELRKTMDLLKSVIECTSDAVYAKDIKGCYTLLNPTVAAIVGKSSSEVIGKDDTFLFPDDEAKVVMAGDCAVMASGTAKTYEETVTMASGEVVTLLSTKGPLVDGKGNIVGLWGIAHDITKRKAYETIIAESRNLLITIINTAPIRVFWKDRNLSYLGCNLAFAKDAGMEKPDDVIGKDDYQLAWADRAERYRADDRAVLESDTAKLSYDEPITSLSGQQIWLRTSKVVLKNNDNETFGLLGIYEDITERKHTEDVLNRQATLIELAHDAILTRTAEGEIMYWNQGAEQAYGWTKAEALGQITHQFLRTVFPQSLEALEDELLTQGQWAGELTHTRRDGSQIVVASRHVLYRDKHDQPELILEINRNITELKNAQDRLEQLTREQLAMLDNELVGIMKLSNRRIIWKNKAIERIFGYGSDEMLGELSRILYPDDASYEAQGEIGYACLKTHGVYRTQLWMVRKDGERLWIDVNGANLSGAEDESIWVLADITHTKNYQEKIEHIAYYDNLTGLPNRLLIFDRLNQALAQAERSDQMLAVCFLDLDGFKPVNDSFGHAAGDKLLVEIAQRLQTSIRANDTVGRLGGDEFVLLLTGLENAKEYQAALERVIQAINQPVALDATQEATVTASIGIALFPQDATNSDTLLRYADQAMYKAKQNGRNRYQFFDLHLEQRIATHREMLEHIRQELDSGEFSLYFQPQVDFDRKALAGMEALIRWQHPTLGLLEPAEFLHFVENDDLALTMGDWVIREALGQMQSWQRDGVDLQVSINLFARQLREPGFLASLQQILSEYPDVPPGRLRLEITETALLLDLPLIQRIITDCQQLGVGFSIDDFGTGYSSLVNLRHLSAAELKIDKSFVLGMLTNHEDQTIVEGIIALGGAFQRSVIAEGVETPGQIRRLLELGCKRMQGYLIARPMPAEQIVAWVREFQPAQLLS